MADLAGSGFDLVVILAFLFVGWYLVGGLWQRRRSGAYVRTLGQAATALAAGAVPPRLSWLGQAGFQLVVDDAVTPFRKLSIVVFLAPREALALWLYALVRRRGDTVVVRADLRERPARRGRSGTAATVGVREVLLSPESPNFVAVLDPAWVRATPTDDIVRAVRTAAGSAGG